WASSHGKEKRKAKAGRFAALALVTTKVDTHQQQSAVSSAVRSPGRSRPTVEGGVGPVAGA
ncbi:TPA: hypothetical protein ACGW1K_002735, partial [Stenotrophomonas maltophilia]